MKKIVGAIIICSLILFTGCGEPKTVEKEMTKEEKIAVKKEKSVLPKEEIEEKIEEKEKKEPKEEKEEAEKEEAVSVDGIVSKLTGLVIEEEVSKRRPIVVMLDNHYKARPQAGISEADVVYEVLAEGLITRYMAVFQTNIPSNVGPVRSARPYYIERALEYNPLYVHVGGSMEALTNIINFHMADIDGLASGVFKRTKHKRMPHNAYVNLSDVRKEANRKGYYKEVEFSGIPISNAIYDLEGENAKEIEIYYKNPSSKDKIGYSIGYRYDEENKNYKRIVNKKPHLDENDKNQIIADNIIIQIVSHKVIDKEGRRKVAMIGSGKAKYIHNGKVIDMKWKKTSKEAATKFYVDDKEILLNPGKTWIQVISPNMNASIK